MALLALNQGFFEVGTNDLAYRYCDWLPEENGRPECYQQLWDLDSKAAVTLFNPSNYTEARKKLQDLGRNFCETPQKSMLCYSDVEQWLSSYDSMRKNLIWLTNAAARATINIER